MSIHLRIPAKTEETNQTVNLGTPHLDRLEFLLEVHTISQSGKP